MYPVAVLKESAESSKMYVTLKIDEATEKLIDALGIDPVDVLPEKVKFELGKLLALAYHNGYVNHYEATQKKKIFM